MGAVTFSLDPSLIQALASSISFSHFIETGTFEGDTIAAFQNSFGNLISIEKSKDLCLQAQKRFASQTHIRILEGDSAENLKQLSPELRGKNVLYWLDAHWCVATGTAGELSQCPLLDELKAIATLGAQSVVLIDDARLFLAPPLAPHDISHWPTLQQIMSTLLSISHVHEVMIINDVIAFFPLNARKAMVRFAQNNGIDWLAAANAIKNPTHLANQLIEKELFIQEQNTLLENFQQSLNEKEILIQEQNTLLENFQQSLNEKESLIQEQIQVLQTSSGFIYTKLFRIFKALIRRVKAFVRPRLGCLNQYAPRQMTLNKVQTSRKNNNLPKISIVTPSYEQGRFIERTIGSVLNQNYPNLEYYVQDGGSIDSTVSILKSYQNRLSGWVSEKDSGQSQAINRGMEKTSGEVMAWLNSDDLLLPNSLHIVADYFNKHPNVDVVYGNRLLIDENDMEIGRWILPGHDSKILSWADYVPQETLFWRRRIWDKVGGQIDESFRFAMDWDLLVRFREANANFAHIPEFLGAFRIHEHQKTSASINEIGFNEMNKIRARLLGKVPNYIEIRKAILIYLAKHVIIDITYRFKVRLKNFT